MLESFQISLHLHPEERFALYEKKYGTAKAVRMMKAEKDLFRKYQCLGHILWQEMGDRYVETARKVAKDVDIPYVEYSGRSDFMRELLAGGSDKRRFLQLQPGQSIDMDVNGELIAVPYSA